MRRVDSLGKTLMLGGIGGRRSRSWTRAGVWPPHAKSWTRLSDWTDWLNCNLEMPASPMAQMVLNQPAMQEAWVRSLGGEDPLEKEMATHSSILAWRIPWTEEPGRLQSTGSQRVGHDWVSDTVKLENHCSRSPSTCLLQVKMDFPGGPVVKTLPFPLPAGSLCFRTYSVHGPAPSQCSVTVTYHKASVLPRSSSKESTCQCRRHKRFRFDPWVRKIPWRRAWQPIPGFLPGKIPWTEEPGALQSTGSKRVGQDWATEHTQHS